VQPGCQWGASHGDPSSGCLLLHPSTGGDRRQVPQRPMRGPVLGHQ
jgi:hypothetical protein